MGDADNDAIPVGEFEEGALLVDDERLESLMLISKFVADLSLCVNQICAKVKDLENFRLFFTALNLLVLPIVMALFLSYGAGDTITGFQSLVTYLMYFSGGVGLPFYVYTAWKYYSLEDQAKTGRVISHSEDPDIQVLEAFQSGSAIFLSGESLAEKLYDFAKILNNIRRMDRELLEPEAGPKISNRINECTQPGFLEGTNISTVAASEYNDLPGANANENSESDLPILYEFQIRMKKSSPDLEVKIEPGANENSESTVLKLSPLYEEKNKQVLVGNLLEL